jgi:hypothetical protein
MKTLREMINLIESVNALADGYLLMLYNYPYSIHKTPEEAQVAIENSGESDGSWKVVPFQFGANLGESAVAEGSEKLSPGDIKRIRDWHAEFNMDAKELGKYLGISDLNAIQDVINAILAGSTNNIDEDQATAQMGLMSAMGSNSDAPDRKQQAAQAIERSYNK